MATGRIFRAPTAGGYVTWSLGPTAEMPSVRLVPGSLWYATDTGKYYKATSSTTWVELAAAGGGSGTVTSVGLAGGDDHGTPTGTPVTTAGTITLPHVYGLHLWTKQVTTGSYSADPVQDSYLQLSPSGNIAVTLPDTATLPTNPVTSTKEGKVYLFKRLLGGNNTATIACAGSDTFDDGSGTNPTLLTLSRVNDFVVLISRASGWSIVATNIAEDLQPVYTDPTADQTILNKQVVTITVSPFVVDSGRLIDVRSGGLLNVTGREYSEFAPFQPRPDESQRIEANQVATISGGPLAVSPGVVINVRPGGLLNIDGSPEWAGQAPNIRKYHIDRCPTGVRKPWFSEEYPNGNFGNPGAWRWVNPDPAVTEGFTQESYYMYLGATPASNVGRARTIVPPSSGDWMMACRFQAVSTFLGFNAGLLTMVSGSGHVVWFGLNDNGSTSWRWAGGTVLTSTNFNWNVTWAQTIPLDYCIYARWRASAHTLELGFFAGANGTYARQVFAPSSYNFGGGEVLTDIGPYFYPGTPAGGAAIFSWFRVFTDAYSINNLMAGS